MVKEGDTGLSVNGKLAMPHLAAIRGIAFFPDKDFTLHEWESEGTRKKMSR
jgi:hypothetical protein